LPWISDVVLRVGLAVRDNLLWVGLLAVIAGAAAVSALSRASVRQRLLGWLGRVPVLGEWLRETEVGRWASMMSSLLGSRVPILRAMELSSRGVALAGLRAHLEHAIRGVRGGKSLADAVSGSVWVDDTAVNLIRTGEASGQLPLMLQTLAKLREARAKERLRRFLILLEPAAILVIGGIIGTVMIAIMLAITSLSNIAL
jgi:general secretion pathway protein F